MAVTTISVRMLRWIFAAPTPQTPVSPVWDFFVTRTDGTAVRFHTDYTDNKVAVARVSVDPPELPRPPAAGKGRGDGKGTYRSKTRCNYTAIERSPQNGGGAGSAVAEPEGDAPQLALDNGGPRAAVPPA